MYRNFESLWSTLETNRILYVNYTLMKKYVFSPKLLVLVKTFEILPKRDWRLLGKPWSDSKGLDHSFEI